MTLYDRPERQVWVPWSRKKSETRVNWSVRICEHDENMTVDEMIDLLNTTRNRLLADGIADEDIKIGIDATTEADYGGDRAVAEMVMRGSRLATPEEAKEELAREDQARQDRKAQDIAAAKARLAELERNP